MVFDTLNLLSITMKGLFVLLQHYALLNNGNMAVDAQSLQDVTNLFVRASVAQNSQLTSQIIDHI